MDEKKQEQLREEKKQEIAQAKEQFRAQKHEKREELLNEFQNEQTDFPEKEEKKEDRMAEKRRRYIAHLAYKKAQREKRAEGGKKRGNPNMGLVIAVVVLGVAVLAISSAFTVYYAGAESKMTVLDGVYQRAFYDLQDHVDRIDSDLSKLSVASSAPKERELLTDVALSAELAENSLQELPFSDENKFYTAKLINQIGDYAKFLQKETEKGSISESERETVLALGKSNRILQEKLAKIADNMPENYAFRDLMTDTESTMAIGLSELEENADSLPRLIYDGPFSEAREDEYDTKGLSGDPVNDVEAREIFLNFFAGSGISDVTYWGEITANGLNAFSFSAKKGDGDEIYGQISETGGKLLLFSDTEKTKDPVLTEEECADVAETFLSRCGIENMTAVWADTVSGACTVNLVYEQDGVICYPDMIKVKVDAADGTVLGMEAYSYYLNHTHRSDLAPALTRDEARARLYEKIDVRSERLCLSPTGRGTEELCYEFSGTANGQTFYVYLSAKTGEEVEIFRVVEGTEGTLLL